MKYLKIDYLKNGNWRTIVFNKDEVSSYTISHYVIEIVFKNGIYIEFTSKKNFIPGNITNNYLTDEKFEALKTFIENLGEEL